MLDVLFTILYILLFLVCLSILIIVHELGHLTAAKIFKVYCLEFSCGMGPLLFKYKRKGGETQLSLRAIPFGGYVTMYGEGVELPDGVTLDNSRSFTGISRWKRAIILVAGVAMNAILALLIFMVKNVAFEQQSFVYANYVTVVEDSKAYEAGLRDLDLISFDGSFDSPGSVLLGTTVKDINGESHFETTIGTLNYKDGTTKNVALVMNPVSSFTDPIYTYSLYGISGNHVVSSEKIEFSDQMSSLEINIKSKVYVSGDEGHEVFDVVDHFTTLDIQDGVLEDPGLRVYVDRYKYNFGEAIGQSFKDFGESSTAIFDSLIGLFTGEVGADQFSGVVGIGFEAKNILDSLGVPMFIFLWGLISVNLAIINLLPFPGLDGWQLLVCAIEGIFHKKIPDKVQSIVSFIGIALLLVLMVVILFKDLWVYVFKGLFGGIFLL